MMKQQKLFLKQIATLSLLFSLAFGSLTGCAAKLAGEPDAQNNVAAMADKPDTARTPEDTQPETEKEAAFPGSYTVPDGWTKLNEYPPGKIFYVEDGHENDELPDNISIETGTNRYSEDEHEKFREAILRQLSMQVSGLDARVFGSGTYTEQGYVLYIFTISEENRITKLYYIVGDHRYCLIHLTKFTDSERLDEAAQAMADSFVWE